MRFSKYLTLFFILFACLGLKASATTDSLVLKKINSLATAVGKSLAPDKRTAVYNIQLKDTPVPELTIETTLPQAVDSLRAAFTTAGIKLNITPKLLPDAALGDRRFAVVTLSVANNRHTPSHGAEMMTQMMMGTPVELLKKQGGYYLVRSPDLYISWVDGDALAILNAKAFEDWKSADKLIYTADFGFSYTEPHISSLRVSDLVKGNLFKLLGKEKGFYKIAYPDQRIAYIPLKDAADYQPWVKRPNPTAEQLLATAKTFMGVPYLWGGTSIKGVDCSGFTKTAFFLHGIIIPRDASQQVLVGDAVDVFEADTVNFQKSLKNLLPGDLLFFALAKGKVPNPRITHVAIYMGGGRFIQSAGRVKINSLDPSAADYAPSQALTMVSARRILPCIGTPELTRVDQHPLYTNLQP
ncbi:hypothetical protein IWX76_002204 [Pedobacter sp. CAN_A7]|uniref:NlpC/P60 family protein n=1 Tax=Pedobacter sp. CAN_A7 TaxID=2787722 RepID=UPI0018C9AA1A